MRDFNAHMDQSLCILKLSTHKKKSGSLKTMKAKFESSALLSGEIFKKYVCVGQIDHMFMINNAVEQIDLLLVK